MMFTFKKPFKKCFNIVVFPLGRRDPVFGAAICVAAVRNSIVFRNSVSADRSQWNGCVQVPRCCGCMRNTMCFAAQNRKS